MQPNNGCKSNIQTPKVNFKCMVSTFATKSIQAYCASTCIVSALCEGSRKVDRRLWKTIASTISVYPTLIQQQVPIKKLA